MANPQKENGYTAIANELLEQIMCLNGNGTQLKILLAVLRQTYGYNRKAVEISITTLEKMTGMSKTMVKRQLAILIERNILVQYAAATVTKGRVLGINKDYENWGNIDFPGNKTTPVESATIQGAKHTPGEEHSCLPLEGYGSDPIKEREKQEERQIKAKEHTNQIINYTTNEQLQRALEEFVLMRRSINKPVSEGSLALRLAKLDQLAQSDEEKIAIVRQSLDRRWQGFFPLKGGKSDESASSNQENSQFDELLWQLYGASH